MFDLAGVELEPKAEQFKTEIEQLKSEIIKRDRKIIELNDQISEMYQSRSWRWSSLIRIMGNLTRYIKEKTLRFFKKMVFLKEDLQLKINRNFTLKIVFISAYPGTPGHVYRVERYVQTYRDLGCFANWIPLDQLSFFRKDIITANIIIFWRVEDSIEIETLIKSAKNNNAIIIYDIDDYIFDPDIADENHLDQIRSIDNKAYQFKLFSKRINALVSIVDYCTGTTIPLVKGFQKFGKTAFLLPNGFDDKVQSQDILTKKKEDDCIKIGYAGGTLTHQRDFKEVVPALVKIFSEYGNVKLIVFKKVLLLNEFPELSKYVDRIEIRDTVPFSELPIEMVRFDINLAPLEVNNIFCEGKSELKYFDAALLKIPTIASPTDPFIKAIKNGENGFLAYDSDDWYNTIKSLIQNKNLREMMGKAAYDHAMVIFGPVARKENVKNMLISIKQIDARLSMVNWI